MPKKLTVDEMLRLACCYAERDQEAFLAAMDNCRGRAEDDEIIARAEEFIKKVRAYRLKRWGKTRLEALCDDAKPTGIQVVAGRPNLSFKPDLQ